MAWNIYGREILNIGEDRLLSCFPNCGSVPDDAPLFIMGDEGVIEGHLPRHGLVRKKDFEHKIINDNQIMFSIESNSKC